MSTIYDVAKLARVSTATVSRVFNGAGVSQAKVEAVRRAAAELNFSPSRVARNLRRQASEIIALIIPDVGNPYFTEMVRGVEDVASEAGYSVVLCNSDGDPAKEDRYLQISTSESMAGVIIAPASPSGPTVLDDVVAAGRPVVIVDRGSPHQVDRVVMDNHGAGRLATDSLLRAGYRRIAHIAGPADINTARERSDGWREELSSQGLGSQDELLRFASFHVDGGRRAMAELLDLPEPPDAVVAGNNLIGVGAIQILNEHGSTPPRVGVAVIGSLPFSTISPSAITVVRLAAREMGSDAARMLLQRIGGDTQPVRTIVLRPEVEAATAEGSATAPVD